MTKRGGAAWVVAGLVMTAGLILVGCATVAETLAPIPSPPNLVGRWKGDWGGTMFHRVEITVEKQEAERISGTMTVFEPRRDPYTLPMTGTIGAKKDGSVWAVLVIQARTTWDFPLKVVSEKRVEGTGRSPGHYGPVTLNRE